MTNFTWVAHDVYFNFEGFDIPGVGRAVIKKESEVYWNKEDGSAYWNFVNMQGNWSIGSDNVKTWGNLGKDTICPTEVAKRKALELAVIAMYEMMPPIERQGDE